LLLFLFGIPEGLFFQFPLDLLKLLPVLFLDLLAKALAA